MKVAAMDESSGKITRRRWLDLAAGSAVAAVGLPAMGKDLANRQSLPPIRQVTHGPKFHWFGYYDKRQFDPTGRYLLSMEVDFEHRSPGPDDVATVGMIDMADGDRWIELGQTSAWCWQQGCMLQWLPGSAGEILWNDRQRDHFVCHILDAKTRAKRTIPHPIYAVSPDGRWAVAPDFSRLHDMRPGYGYAGVPDRYKADLAPKNTGVFRIDLGTGRQELIIRLADVARIPHPRGDLSRMKHYFNHLLVSPDGARFEFFDLWIEAKKMVARMLTAAPDGTDLRMLDPTGNTSHFIWRDPRHILAWSLAAAGRRLLPVPGQTGRQRRADRQGGDVARRRSLHVSSRESPDPVRHLPRPAALSARVSIRRHPQPERVVGRFLPAAEIRGRVALRHASPLQPRWSQRRHRLPAHRPRPPVAPDRHQLLIIRYRLALLWAGLLACSTAVPLAAGELTVVYPVRYALYQRTIADSGPMRIRGTFRPAQGVGSIEARFNAGPWQVVDANPQNGSFCGTITAVVGQGRLELRVHGDRAIAATIEDVSVGDLFSDCRPVECRRPRRQTGPP